MTWMQVVHLSGNTSTTLSLELDDRDIGGNLALDIAILTLVCNTLSTLSTLYTLYTPTLSTLSTLLTI